MTHIETPDTIISANYAAMSKKAAHEIAALLHSKPDAVIGLATGSTPIGMYAELVRMHEEEGLDFSQATFFNLDEYVGIPHDHPQSYHHFMHEHLFSNVNANPERIHIPNGNAVDLEAECARYEQGIKDAGGIDLQVLGIGANGHIGFCEPGTDFTLGTHITQLTEQTRNDNARFFDDDHEQVPTEALSMGPATIMSAKRIIVLANNTAKTNKTHAVHDALYGDVTQDIPATILQKHPDVSFYLDWSIQREVQKMIASQSERSFSRD
ncbi:MAG: glucosamine-6-phosphate deaminase [Alphaproteobacteria bacterium]|nr:MAG: glucosamine-6-phosphate deaminase [Alphaproteobacteria bacterium]